MLKIGHRGAKALAPENTMASFKKAVELGVDMIELDLQLTADQYLVVCHDNNLMRLLGIDDQISNLKLAELKQINFGSWFGSEFHQEQIPTLREVIRLIRGRVKLNIELKPQINNPQLVINRLIDLLEAKNFKSEVIISSFNHRLIREVYRVDSTLQTAILITSLPIQPTKLIEAAFADGIHPHYLAISEQLVEEIHSCDYFINVWTVNQLAVIEDLIAWGVDGIMTDDPRIFNSN
ncbi:MAG: glycerophosphodiester phosphodiesterase [Bacillota bacterium]